MQNYYLVCFSVTISFLPLINFNLKERATLKHRNGSKKIQQLSRYASRNPEVKRFFEEQIRLGRTLTEKHGGGGISDTDESDDDNNNKKFSSHDLLQVFDNQMIKVAKLFALFL